MTAPVDIRTPLERVARAWMPRILTQICRDPTSPFHGCADRNWWHYKIRDFSSIILQQAGYAVHLAGRLPDWSDNRERLDRLAAASARFWNRRALKHHAFEEYYPWEQGYPPLAFSTLAVAKLADSGLVTAEELRPGLRIAARQLRNRFEAEAANQQVAGLAALAWIDRVLPDAADPSAFAEQKARTLALQHGEGWYTEYDGPDLGYLSVTIDCLWDLYDATGDEDYRDSTRRAVAFAARLLAAAPAGLGLHNSRNTDYLVPYGIVRSALQGGGQERRDSAQIAAAAFAEADAPHHFLAAVDDRYLCHYVGQSLFRALQLLQQGQPEPVAVPPPPVALLFQGSGHYLDAGLIVSCRKGGILTIRGGGMDATDCGWIIKRGKQQFVSHWWSDRWDFRRSADSIEVQGHFFAHKERPPTPPKHILLRALSFTLGRRVTGLLKRALIFKRGDGAEPALLRSVSRTGGGVRIVDRITGLRPTDKLIRAPRASKRHVASADSFHAQDFSLLQGFEVEEERIQDGAALTITTRLTPRIAEGQIEDAA